ncbi:unnamed protein product [Rotaria socialis]|uniref:Uncharacterized protein n=1 Tax=Rotaria socialis TaxID=392032 RepID=A0A817WJ01_9BILA|nr:unnamed protein product [Rotaria socialis]
MRWPKEATQGNVIVGGNGQGRKSNRLNAPNGLSFDRNVFTLPTSKFLSYPSDETIEPILLPLATDQQLTIIEHLVINHSCNFNEQPTSVSYNTSTFDIICSIRSYI